MARTKYASKPASATVLALGLLMLWATLYSAPADSARRIALVIGNGDYSQSPDLYNPVNDAKAMADKLRSLDFSLIGGQAHTNVNKANMDRLLGNLEDQLRNSGTGTTALVFYSGHGVAEENQSWLVPVDDGDIEYREDVPDKAVGANRVMQRLERAGGRLNILILDACRNSPLPSRYKSGGDKGIVPVKAGNEADSMIVFAAAPGQVAFDGPRNGLSPFTKALIEEMDEPGRRLVDVVAKVKAKVRRETEGDPKGPQVPWVNHSIERPFYFVPCPPGTGCGPTVIIIDPPPPLPEDWQDLDQKKECSECPLMVAVPSGEYAMGSSSADKELLGGEYDTELPRRSVSVRRFAVGVHEVTFSQWDACHREGGCSSKPSDNGWGRGSRPVIDVSWNDAKQYVEWLSRKTGKTYRLLSESEWEYVARAGTKDPFHTGSTISTKQANFGNSQRRTIEVGRLANNRYGLHDVHGNVWEWVQDCWHGNYRGAPDDGSAWTQGGDCGKRVFRGGSWKDESNYARSAYRWGADIRQRAGNIGFRVARELH